jgi:hypothetical protein
MTRKEHLLMIGIVAKQYQMIRVLLDLLKNKQIISDGDLEAFQFVAMRDDDATLALVRQVRSFHVQAATEACLETGLKSVE